MKANLKAYPRGRDLLRLTTLLASIAWNTPSYSAVPCSDLIAIVADPWSSARALVEELERRGIATHGIQSGASIPDWAHDTFYLAENRSLLVFDGNFESLEETVSAIRPNAILYGADGKGIELVDRLTERFELRGNVTAYTRARRTKIGIQKLLEDAKRNHLKGILTNELTEAIAFARKVGSYPVFIKPNDDGGGTLAFQINSDSELKEKLELILNSVNTTTKERHQVAAIQELADGVEFAVQGTVRDGIHKFSSVLEYESTSIDSNVATYQSEWIMDPGSAEAQILMDFVEDANAVVGFRNGPFHWELKISKRKNGVVAIELNPRLIGGSMLAWLKDCVGYNDAELTVEAYFFPQEFNRRPRIYSVQKPGFVYEIVTPREGLELDKDTLGRISKMPGFKRLRLLKPKGGALPKTVNLDTIAGTIDFSHESKEVLQGIYQELSEINDRGLFFRK